jgi:hypothetical protein
LNDNKDDMAEIDEISEDVKAVEVVVRYACLVTRIKMREG